MRRMNSIGKTGKGLNPKTRRVKEAKGSPEFPGVSGFPEFPEFQLTIFIT